MAMTRLRLLFLLAVELPAQHAAAAEARATPPHGEPPKPFTRNVLQGRGIKHGHRCRLRGRRACTQSGIWRSYCWAAPHLACRRCPRRPQPPALGLVGVPERADACLTTYHTAPAGAKAHAVRGAATGGNAHARGLLASWRLGAAVPRRLFEQRLVAGPEL